jgi:hypothetical protein
VQRFWPCSKCKKLHNRSSPSGRQYYCHDCHSKASGVSRRKRAAEFKRLQELERTLAQALADTSQKNDYVN